jgi:hypothetical protein
LRFNEIVCVIYESKKYNHTLRPAGIMSFGIHSVVLKTIYGIPFILCKAVGILNLQHCHWYAATHFICSTAVFWIKSICKVR